MITVLTSECPEAYFPSGMLNYDADPQVDTFMF